MIACCAGTRVTSTALTGSPISRNNFPLVPVPTSNDPSGSAAMSYGASSRGVHISSQRPSGWTRKMAPVGLRRSCDDNDAVDCGLDVVSTAENEVISVETLGMEGVTGGGVDGASVMSLLAGGRALCAAV